MNIVYKGKDYTLVYDKAREVITLNAHNTGIMHKGNNVRSMDKWNKIGSVALDLQTKQTVIETVGVKKFTGLEIPTRLDENTLYDILTTIKLPGDLKSEIMTTGGMSGVENYTIGLTDAKNKLGIQFDGNTGTIVANYKVNVGKGSVEPFII